MKLRHKETGATGYSNQFNTHGLGEIIVRFDEGDMDSMNISDFEVLIDNVWKDMSQAFKDRDLIPDNYNTHFAQPNTPADRARGYY